MRFLLSKSKKLGINDFIKNQNEISEDQLKNFVFKKFLDDARLSISGGKGGDGTTRTLFEKKNH